MMTLRVMKCIPRFVTKTSENASRIKAKNTFTAFNQPPDLGRFFINPGNIASNVNGSAKDIENPSIPITGLTISPCIALPRTTPTIGPVQEKLITTVARAIKKGTKTPPLSACWSILFERLPGSVISNIPKNEKARARNIRKNITLGSQ
ncbi:hypothetical protein ES708_24954 [subsurface metagenome]